MRLWFVGMFKLNAYMIKLYIYKKEIGVCKYYEV